MGSLTTLVSKTHFMLYDLNAFFTVFTYTFYFKKTRYFQTLRFAFPIFILFKFLYASLYSFFYFQTTLNG